MPSDVFRPRLPLDPFANLQHSVPWRIPADLAPSPPQVIFTLGEPLLADLLPLIHSPHLAQSLLLIATHVPLALPTTAAGQGPALRILRLAAPLHVHDTGALRLVSLFERAQRVAALWRSSSTTPHILYLAEDGPNGEFTLVDAPEKKYPSPAPSIASVKRARSIKNRLSMLSESLQAAGSVVSLTSSPSPKKARRSLITFGKDPAGNTTSSPSRSFDAIVNFLPSGLPEKALFKQSILVTTLSAQYLVLPYTHASGSAPGSDPHAYHYQRRSSSPPTPLALPSFSSSASASSSSSLSSSLAAPPKAQTSITQRHHRRFSSFALTSYPDARNSACSSPTPSSRASGDESPALRPESRTASSYGLFSSAVTTPATTPGGELSADEAFCQEEDDDIRALKMSRRKSLTKRLSTLFASVSRPVSISSAADLAAADMEMDVLGASARPSRPQNAHIVHVLPADWTPAPTPPPSSANLSFPYAKARAPPSYTKPKLVQGIEQFLLSFAYPLAGLSDVSSQSSPRNHTRRSGAPPSAYRQGFNSYNQRPESWGSVASAGAGAGGGQLSSLLGEESSKARAVPYLVAPGMFGRALGDRKGKGRARQSQWLTAEKLYEEAVEEYDEEEEEEDGEGTVEDGSEEIEPRVRVRRRRNVTLGEVVLLGALDLDAGADPEDMSGNRAAVGCGRAWIAEDDVELVGVAAGDVVEVRRSTTVRRKEKGKEVQESKEDSTASLGLPTPPRSQRSSTSSTSADSAEGSVSAPLTRSNSTGSCSEGAQSPSQSPSQSADASQVDVQTQASTTTTSTTTAISEPAEAAVTMTGASARASVIAVPPRAAPRRESSESAASASCSGSAFASGSGSGVTSGSGSGSASASVVLGGVPMSRSPSTGLGKAPHYVPATLVAKQQEEGVKDVVVVGDVGDSVRVPPAVHLLGGGGGSGSVQSSSAVPTNTPPSASTAARPAESSGIPVVDGAPTGSVGTGTGVSAASATDAAAGTQKPTNSTAKLGLNLHLRTSMRLRAPALLREQTKVKAKARPASMIVLGDRSLTQAQVAQAGEKRGSGGGYGVLPAFGSALRRVQGFGSGVLASGIALGRSASLKVKREEKAKESV